MALKHVTYGGNGLSEDNCVSEWTSSTLLSKLANSLPKVGSEFLKSL